MKRIETVFSKSVLPQPLRYQLVRYCDEQGLFVWASRGCFPSIRISSDTITKNSSSKSSTLFQIVDEDYSLLIPIDSRSSLLSLKTGPFSFLVPNVNPLFSLFIDCSSMVMYPSFFHSDKTPFKVSRILLE